MEERNRERGFTSSDLKRARDNEDEAKLRYAARRVTTSVDLACMTNAEVDQALHEHPLAVGADEIVPTQEEWGQMLAKSKSRKRGIDKIAKQFGYELVGDDKKDRLCYEKVAA